MTLGCRNVRGRFAKCSAGNRSGTARGRRDPAALQMGKTIYEIVAYTPPNQEHRHPSHSWTVKGPRGGYHYVWRSTRKGSDFVLSAGQKRIQYSANQVKLLGPTVGPRPKVPRDKKPPSKPHGLKVGSILVNSWGYDQTNIDFYMVVALRGATGVTICPIGARVASAYRGADYVVPALGKCAGKPMNKKVGDGDSVKIHSWGSYARPWSGEARYQTAFGAGH